MKNLVYKDGYQPFAPQSIIDALNKQATQRFDEYMERNVFRKRDVYTDAMIGLARKDGVAPQFAGDHAKDMGMGYPNPILGSRVDFATWDDPFKWRLIDGPMAGRKIAVEDRPPGHTITFMDTSRRQTHTYKRDRLARYFFYKSDNFEVMFPTYTTQDPNKQQGGAEMAQVKKTTDIETPIAQTQPKLGLYFRINQLPQELTQKQTVEHVTKLLTLGADTINVQRYIRDEVSARSATRY